MNLQLILVMIFFQIVNVAISSQFSSRIRAPTLNSIQALLEQIQSPRLRPVTCSETGQTNNVKGVCMKTSACTQGRGRSWMSTACTRLGMSCCVVSITGSPTLPSTVVTQPAVTLQANGMEDSETEFVFPKQPGICGLTVNFLDTRLAQPASGTLTEGNCLVDWVTVTGSHSLIAGYITVCGDLSGQHMHLSYGDGSLAAMSLDRITILVKTASAATKYNINVVQVGCDDPALVSTFCLQKFVGDVVQVRSFGYPRQLNNLYYHICTTGSQPEARTTTWEECPNSLIGGGVGASKFLISGSPLSDGTLTLPEFGGHQCAGDYVESTLLDPPGRHCGGGFPKVTVNSGVGHMTVNFNEDEYGQSAILLDRPPGINSCEDVPFTDHDCTNAIVGENKDTTCICTLPDYNLISFPITVLPNELCPTAEGYTCAKNTATNCNCDQQYIKADQANTGFCLQATHNY